jgi:hypothetical protein
VASDQRQLLKRFRALVAAVSAGPADKDDYGGFISQGGKTFDVPRRADPILSQVAELLVTPSGGAFSMRAARGLVRDALAEAVLGDGASATDSAARRLAEHLDRAPLSWACTTVVGGIEKASTPFEFAGVSFDAIPSEPSDLQNLPDGEGWERDLRKQSHLAFTHGQRLARARVLATVSVFALDAGAARARATRRVSDAIDGLVIGARMASGWRDVLITMSPGLEPLDPPFVCRKIDGKGGLSIDSDHSGSPLSIDADCNMTKQRACLARIDADFCDSADTERVRRVRAAVRLAARSFRAYSYGESLLWAIAACEAATRREVGRPSKRRTAARINAILGFRADDGRGRNNAIAFANLYDQRSKIAHGYDVYVDVSAARIARAFALKIIGRLMFASDFLELDEDGFDDFFRSRGAETVGANPDPSTRGQSRFTTRGRARTPRPRRPSPR